MINVDYYKYIKILLILLYENKVMSKSQITTFLNIDSNHYENMINTIRKLKKPDIIYKVNFKHYEFIVFGELNFETGVILGNKFSGDFSKYTMTYEKL